MASRTRFTSTDGDGPSDMTTRLAWMALTVILLASCGSPAPQREIEGELLSTWEPTPHAVVRKMLDLAEVKPRELLYDLGSGDGRIVIAAASEYRVKALGFEIDRDLVHLSQKAIRSKRIGRLARVEAKDLMTADFSPAGRHQLLSDPRGSGESHAQARSRDETRRPPRSLQVSNSRLDARADCNSGGRRSGNPDPRSLPLPAIA